MSHYRQSGALNLKYGSWNDKRIEFDYGGALNESKTGVSNKMEAENPCKPYPIRL